MGCGNSKDAQDTMSKPYDGPRTIVSSALTSPDDIVDYPQFPEGTKSLLSKNLTPAIWN